MRFPLRVSTSKKRLEINDREEFLYNYDQILTLKVKAKIGDEMSSKCLFANWQGFMVGDGKVWFTELSSRTFRGPARRIHVEGRHSHKSICAQEE